MKRLRSAALLLAALLASPIVHAQARCGDGAGATVCLTATGSSSDVTLSWTATDAIDSVQVYRDTDGDPAGRTLLASVEPGTTRYVDSGAAAGKPYWYWVRFAAAQKPRDSNAAAATRVPVASGGGGGTPAMPGRMRDLTSLQLAQQMAPGWNLGNSLEAIGGETAWGNAAVTPSLLKAVKAAGFRSVRIPVSWKQYADSDDNIRADWMARVTEVVNYARDAGLVAIINIHWDGGWMQPTYAQQAASNARIDRFWTQIAEHFRNYDDTLLFAGLNEVMVDGNYNAPIPEYATVHNGFNQVFVKAVRATGGNNARRHLVVQGYNTNIDHTLNFFAVPTDSVRDRLMVEVHYYDPYKFSIAMDDDTVWQWGGIATSRANTDPWADEKYADTQFDKMKRRFIDGLGMPVLLGEYGALSRLKVDAAQRYRTYWNQVVTAAAHAHGLVPTYWDNGYTGDHTMGLFDRATGAQAYPGVISAIVGAAR